VLTRSINTGKRFLVHQHPEVVTLGHPVHHVHHQQVVVDSQVGFFIDGCQLKLIGSHLVVSGLERQAQFIPLEFEVFHKCGHTGRNGPKIMVFQLLVFG